MIKHCGEEFDVSKCKDKDLGKSFRTPLTGGIKGRNIFSRFV